MSGTHEWHNDATSLLSSLLKSHGLAMEVATGQLTAIKGYQHSHNVVEFLMDAAWYILLQVSIKESNNYIKERDYTLAILEIKHTASWHTQDGRSW